MDKRDFNDVTNTSDRKQPLKTAVSMPILGQRGANNNKIRREKRQIMVNMGEVSALPDGGDDDDDLPRTPLTKSTSCYVQQSGGQPKNNKLSGADDQ